MGDGRVALILDVDAPPPPATQGEAMNATANPAKESLRKEQKQQREAARRRGTDDELDEALKETFPASDPLATQTPIKPGGKDKR